MGTSLYKSLLLSTGGFSVSDYIRKFTDGQKSPYTEMTVNTVTTHRSRQTVAKNKQRDFVRVIRVVLGHGKSTPARLLEQCLECE
ncbi:myosin light chain kinase 3-like isoform X1 [Tachysurus ichikawai]